MKRLFLLSIILLSFVSLSSQNYTIVWQRCLGGSESEQARDVLQVEDGYLIVGGSSSTNGDISNNIGMGDGWLVKLDFEGNLLWEKSYGGTDGEHFRCILSGENNTCYLLGNSNSSDGDLSFDPYPDNSDLWISKIDSVGNIIWTKLVGGVPWEALTNGTTTTDGGIIALGHVGASGGDINTFFGLNDIWSIKLDSSGEIEWDYTLGTFSQDFPGSIIETSDNGFIVVGVSELTGGGNLNCEGHGMYDGIIVKFDKDRNIEWQQCYGGSGDDSIGNILEIEDGYILSGTTHSNDGDVSGWHGESDIWVIKVDFNGNIVWQNCFGGSLSEGGGNIFQNNDGGYTIIGNTSSHDGDVLGNHTNPLAEQLTDIWLVKINSDGDFISQQCFGGEENESLIFGVIQKSDNNYIIAGYARENSYDVDCNLHPSGMIPNYDFWVFEIKDCDHYQTTIPATPAGADTLCVQDSIAYFSTGAVEFAGHYAWLVSPPEAGTITGDSLQATYHINPDFQGTATITVKAVNDCGQSDWSDPKYVEIQNCLGIQDNPYASLLRVYPNPANDYVIFTLNTTQSVKTKITITDIFGQEVANFPLKKQKTKWNLKGLAKGVYFYHSAIAGKQVFGKIIVR